MAGHYEQRRVKEELPNGSYRWVLVKVWVPDKPKPKPNPKDDRASSLEEKRQARAIRAAALRKKTALNARAIAKVKAIQAARQRELQGRLLASRAQAYQTLQAKQSAILDRASLFQEQQKARLQASKPKPTTKPPAKPSTAKGVTYAGGPGPGGRQAPPVAPPPTAEQRRWTETSRLMERRYAIENAKKGDAQSVSRLEKVLKSERDVALATGNVDHKYVDAALEKISEHAQDIAESYVDSTERLLVLLDKGDVDKAQKYLDPKTKVGEQYLALVAEYERLFFGPQGEYLKEGALVDAQKNYDDISAAQRLWWKQQLSTQLYQLRGSDRKHDDALEKALADQLRALNGETGYTEWRDPNTGDIVPRKRTIDEELNWQQSQLTIAREKANAERNAAYWQTKIGMGEEGLVEFGGETVQKIDIPIIQAAQAVVAEKFGGKAPPISNADDLTKFADSIVEKWEQDHPEPRKTYPNAAEAAAWESWKRERKYYIEKVYKYFGTHPPEWWERAFQLPVVSPALAILQGGVSAIGAGLRVVEGNARGSTTIGVNDLDWSKAPPGAPDEKKIAAGYDDPFPVGDRRHGGYRNDLLKAREEWLKTPEGQKWMNEQIVAQRQESRDEDLRFAQGFYGANEQGGGQYDALKTLQADPGAWLRSLNEYGSSPFKSDGYNLLFNILADPFNAVPLNVLTYAARGRYAIETAAATKGILGKSKLPFSFVKDFATVDSGTLELRKFAKQVEKKFEKEGLTIEEAVDAFREQIVGIKTVKGMEKAIEDWMVKLGLDPKKVNENQLFNMAESMIVRRMRTANSPLLTQSDAFLKEMKDKLAALKAGKESRQQKFVRQMRKGDAATQKKVAEGKAAIGKLTDVRGVQQKALEKLLVKRVHSARLGFKNPENIVNPTMDRRAFTNAVKKLERTITKAEKQSDPATWTPAEKAAWDSGDWKTFSRLRGYTEEEIADYERYQSLFYGLDQEELAAVMKPGKTGAEINTRELYDLYHSHNGTGPVAGASPPPAAAASPTPAPAPNTPAAAVAAFKDEREILLYGQRKDVTLEDVDALVVERERLRTILKDTSQPEDVRKAANQRFPAIFKAIVAANETLRSAAPPPADLVDVAPLDPNLHVSTPGPQHSAIAKAESDKLAEHVSGPTPVERYSTSDEYFTQDDFGNRLPKGWVKDADYQLAEESARQGVYDSFLYLVQRSRQVRNDWLTYVEDGGETGIKDNKRFIPTKDYVLESAGVLDDAAASARVLTDRRTVRFLKRIGATKTRSADLIRTYGRRDDEIIVGDSRGGGVSELDEWGDLKGHKELFNGEVTTIGEDVLDAAETASGTHRLYSMFTHDSTQYYRFSGADATQMTKKQFINLIYTLYNNEKVGATLWRDGGQILFEVFHQLRLGGEFDKMAEFSDFLTQHLLDTPDNVWGWMWKTMEERSAIPGAMDHLDIQNGFFEAAKTWNLHPELAWATIPHGYRAIQAPLNFGISAKLGKLADSGHYVHPERGYDAQKARDELTDIFIKNEGEPTRVLDYVAERFGDFFKGGSVRVRLEDEMIHSANLEMGHVGLANALVQVIALIPSQIIEAAVKEGVTVESLIARDLRKAGGYVGRMVDGRRRPLYATYRKMAREAYDQGFLDGVTPKGHTMILLEKIQTNPDAWKGHVGIYLRYMKLAGEEEYKSGKELVSTIFDEEIRITATRNMAESSTVRAALNDAISGEPVPISVQDEYHLWNEHGMLPTLSDQLAYATGRAEERDALNALEEADAAREEAEAVSRNEAQSDWTGAVDTSGFEANVTGLQDSLTRLREKYLKSADYTGPDGELINGEHPPDSPEAIAFDREQLRILNAIRGSIENYLKRLLDNGAAQMDQENLDALRDAIVGLGRKHPETKAIINDLQEEMGFVMVSKREYVPTAENADRALYVETYHPNGPEAKALREQVSKLPPDEAALNARYMKEAEERARLARVTGETPPITAGDKIRNHVGTIYASKHYFFKKDMRKADRSNKFIGHGVGPRGKKPASATYDYERAMGGSDQIFSKDDVVFVSANGKTPGRVAVVAPDGRLTPHYTPLDHAIDARSTILTDIPADRLRDYNLGEREVADYLSKRGYKETAPGVWKYAGPDVEATPIESMFAPNKVPLSRPVTQAPHVVAAAAAAPVPLAFRGSPLSIVDISEVLRSLRGIDAEIDHIIDNAARVGTIPDLAKWLRDAYAITDKATARNFLLNNRDALRRLAGEQVNGSILRKFDDSIPPESPRAQYVPAQIVNESGPVSAAAVPTPAAAAPTAPPNVAPTGGAPKPPPPPNPPPYIPPFNWQTFGAEYARISQGFKTIFGMSDEEWFAFERERARKVLVNPRASNARKTAARARIDQIDSAMFAIKFEKGQGIHIPWEKRAAHAKKTVRLFGKDAEEMIAPAYIAPHVTSAFDATVEQGRTLWKLHESVNPVRAFSRTRFVKVKGVVVDHLDKATWELVEETMRKHVNEAHGYTSDVVTKARHRGTRIRSSKRLRMEDKDPAVLAAKGRAVQELRAVHGIEISIQAYDDARAVLWKGHVQRKTSIRLLRTAKRRAAQTGEDISDAYNFVRAKAAKKESRKQLSALAYDEMYGHPPADIYAEFVSRYSDDTVIKDFSPKLTDFQMKTLEANLRDITGLADLRDPKMGQFLQSANHPPFGSRELTKKFLVKIGAWSPRKADDFIKGAKSWSVEEEAKYWLVNYGEIPEWANESLLRGQFNNIFHNMDLYFSQMKSWGVFVRSQELKLQIEGFSAQEIEKMILESQRRELELQRRYAIERYGTLVSKDGKSLDAMPWLMYPDEYRAYLSTSFAKQMGSDMIQSTQDLNEVTALIDKVMDRFWDKYIGGKLDAGEAVTHHDVFRLASEIQAQLLANPKWARRYQDVFGTALNTWSRFNRWFVFSNPAFFVTNTADAWLIKTPYFRFSRRGLFNSGLARANPDLVAKALAMTPASVGQDASTAMYRIKQAGAKTRILHPRGYTGMERAVDQALALLDGTGEIFPYLAGQVELGKRMALARDMYPTVYEYLFKTVGKGDEELTDTLTKAFIKDEMSKMWPTAGDHPIEKLWNRLVPFASYSVRNKLLFISEAVNHPAILNYIQDIGAYVEAENLREWEKRHPGLTMPEYLRRRISLPWAPDYYFDVSVVSDVARGLKPIWDAAGPQTAEDIAAQWVRVVNPSTQAGVYALFNAFGIAKKNAWVPILKDGYPTGAYRYVSVGWTEPWSQNAPDIASVFWGAALVKQTAQYSKDGLSDGEVSMLLGQALFFNGISTFNKGSVYQSYYFTLKDSDPEAAALWLQSPEGEYLQDFWTEHANDPQDVINRLKDLSRAPDPSPWFHAQSPENQLEIKNARAEISSIRATYSNELMALQYGSAEYKKMKGQMYMEINNVYLNHPILMKAEVWSKTPPEWAKQTADWQTDKLMDDFMALEGQRPARGTYANDKGAYDKAVSDWEHQKEVFLQTFPQVATRLSAGRNELATARDKMHEDWDRILTRISLRRDKIDAAKAIIEAKGRDSKEGAKAQDALDLMYLAQDLEYSLLERDYSATLFTPEDFKNLPFGSDAYLSGSAAVPALLKGNFLKRVVSIFDFDRTRYEKAVREGTLDDFISKQEYGEKMKAAILYAKGGDPFGEFSPKRWGKYLKAHPDVQDAYFGQNPEKREEFERTAWYVEGIRALWKKAGDDPAKWVRLLKQDPKLLAEYFKRNKGKKEKWAFMDAYVRHISVWGKLVGAERWDEAKVAWDHLPKWVKDHYMATHDKKHGSGSGFRSAKGSAYFGYMKTWVGLFEKGDKKAAMDYFNSLPKWAKDKYYAKHPDKKAEFELTDMMAEKLRNYFAAESDSQADYLAKNPDLKKWLAQNGGAKSLNRMAILLAYKNIPKDEAWLRRVFRERYPEIFSKEAAGERKLKKVYDTLAAHPDMLPGFEKWLKAVQDSYLEMLKHLPRPLNSFIEPIRKVPARKYKRELSAEETSRVSVRNLQRGHPS